MNNHNTHLLRHYTDRSELSRIADGMILAVRHNNGVAFGPDPRQQQQRVFTDESYAKAFLRKLADIDQAGECDPALTPERARIEEQEASKLVHGAMVKAN